MCGILHGPHCQGAAVGPGQPGRSLVTATQCEEVDGIKCLVRSTAQWCRRSQRTRSQRQWLGGLAAQRQRRQFLSTQCDPSSPPRSRRGRAPRHSPTRVRSRADSGSWSSWCPHGEHVLLLAEKRQGHNDLAAAHRYAHRTSQSLASLSTLAVSAPLGLMKGRANQALRFCAQVLPLPRFSPVRPPHVPAQMQAHYRHFCPATRSQRCPREVLTPDRSVFRPVHQASMFVTLSCRSTQMQPAPDSPRMAQTTRRRQA